MENSTEKIDMIYNELHEKYFDKYEKMRTKDKRNGYIGIIGFCIAFMGTAGLNAYLEDKEGAELILYLGIIQIVIRSNYDSFFFNKEIFWL